MSHPASHWICEVFFSRGKITPADKVEMCLRVIRIP